MRILLVEDEKKVADFIQKGLKEESFDVEIIANGNEAIEEISKNKFDLIIMDIMIPGKDGVEVCKNVRKQGILTPVIMLTGKDTIDDKIKGLDAGADDYLCKPFSFSELIARIRALIRRDQEYKGIILKVADLEFDLLSRRVNRAGKVVQLTGKEYALLEFLMRNKGRVVSELEIVENVWDMSYDPVTNVVNVYIHHLRNKMDRGFSKKLIYTVRGKGYIMKDE